MIHFLTSVIMITVLTCIPTAHMIGVFTDAEYQNPFVFGVLILTFIIGGLIWRETHTKEK